MFMLYFRFPDMTKFLSSDTILKYIGITIYNLSLKPEIEIDFMTFLDLFLFLFQRWVKKFEDIIQVKITLKFVLHSPPRNQYTL